MEKQRITTFVHKEVKDALEAEKDERTLSNHIANILTKHVQKKQIDKPFQPKKEYGK